MNIFTRVSVGVLLALMSHFAYSATPPCSDQAQTASVRSFGMKLCSNLPSQYDMGHSAIVKRDYTSGSSMDYQQLHTEASWDYFFYGIQPDEVEAQNFDAQAGVLVGNNYYTRGKLVLEGYVSGYYNLPVKTQAQVPLGAVIKVVIDLTQPNTGQIEVNDNSLIYLYDSGVKTTLSLRYSLNQPNSHATWSSSTTSASLIVTNGDPNALGLNFDYFGISSNGNFSGPILDGGFGLSSVAFGLRDDSGYALRSTQIPSSQLISLSRFTGFNNMSINVQTSDFTPGSIYLRAFRVSWQPRR